jgi:RNA polymerase sigma-70 factor (ECF subfamily)
MRHRVRSNANLIGMEENTPSKLCALIDAVARSQDRAAFADLFAHFAPRVKGYLMRLGANGALAEDLAQEAMLLLWRKAPLYDASKASPSTWVFTIARNLRIDAIRRERRPEIDPSELEPEPERAADEGMVRVEDEIRVREAIMTLPGEQAQVVELSFFADKPHSTIAKELGLPLGTVKSRLRLAMARIRAALGEDAS